MAKKIAGNGKLLTKLNTIKSWQVACVIAVVGLGVFFSGLNGGFQGDDKLQIVDNLPVHSLSNLPQFFGSSTFWNGESLVGSFYRPMMTVTFSLIYSLFGANPLAFHIFQLLLYIACAFVLFLFIRPFFKSALALLVALLFLVHPINSQVVFAIPSMQEPLFFLFGILALFTLSRSQTNKSFVIAALFLLLSMLSKESGIIFAGLTVVYLGLFKRERTFSFIKIAAIPAILYILLREHAVGFLPSTIHAAPISTLSFGERMLTLPSIIVFYIGTFLFPANLATSYYWTHQAFNISDVAVPLAIVVLIIGGLIYAGNIVKKRALKNEFLLYLFFGIWAIVGLLPYLQIIPLDMTACEPWFFASIPGFLGMIAVLLSTAMPKPQTKWVYIIAVPIIFALGVRTAIRGVDYASQYTLASKDISVSKDSYLAMNNLAQSLIQTNRLDEALTYARSSINIYPAVTNYTNLGVIKQKQGDFDGAKRAYEKALEYGSLGITYENLGIVNLTVGDHQKNVIFFHEALKAYPRNNRVWTYLAIQEAENGAHQKSKVAITTAAHYGAVPQQLYYAIMNEQAFDITLPGSNRIIHILKNI
jgi:protein O-mannosyl-transferase